MSEFLAWKPSSKYFGETEVDMEKLHKPWPKDASHELVETSYFGFSIPEEDLNCEIYNVVHPVFNLVTGGVLIFRGKSRDLSNLEYMEFRDFQPLPDDITDCTYATGLKVKMIEPLSEFRLSFEDPKGIFSFDFTTTGIMPPAFRGTGGHITQAMKNRGKMRLRGKEYEIGGYILARPVMGRSAQRGLARYRANRVVYGHSFGRSRVPHMLLRQR